MAKQKLPARDATIPQVIDLPEGWAPTTLGQVCELNPAKPPRDLLNSDVPVTFVPMAAVNANSGTIAAPEIRPFASVRKGFTSFRDGDVIMAKITPCAENGKAAIACGLQNGIGFGSTEFHVLRSTQAVLPEYVYRFIRQESFRDAAAAEMTGSVGQKRVPAWFLEQSFLPLPPLAEQKRIVAKIDALLARVDAARERLAKVPAILKRFRQSVLAPACSGRLTADWREFHTDIEPASQLLKNISVDCQRTSNNQPEDDLPELPETWVWSRFAFLIGELRNGISTKPNIDPPGTKILRINSVRPGAVLFDDVRFLPDSGNLLSSYRLREGDLLFTRYNGSLDLLGVCGMVRRLLKEPLLYPDKLMRVRFDHAYVVPAYVEIFFQSPDARDRLTARSKSSAGQQGVSGADIKAQPVALPPLEEQREIVRRVEALFKLADAIEKRLQSATARAERLTQSILAKAFRGELVPTEADLARRDGREYEPASALLARIVHNSQQKELSNSRPSRHYKRSDTRSSPRSQTHQA